MKLEFRLISTFGEIADAALISHTNDDKMVYTTELDCYRSVCCERCCYFNIEGYSDVPNSPPKSEEKCRWFLTADDDTKAGDCENFKNPNTSRPPSRLQTRFTLSWVNFYNSIHHELALIVEMT
nr:hypothetical protein CFP56_28479 [Quercus suber]